MSWVDSTSGDTGFEPVARAAVGPVIGAERQGCRKQRVSAAGGKTVNCQVLEECPVVGAVGLLAYFKVGADLVLAEWRGEHTVTTKKSDGSRSGVGAGNA